MIVNEPTPYPVPADPVSVTGPALDFVPDADLDSPLRLGGGEDVAALIPYLLGFHPRESIVVLICVDRRLFMTARLPLEIADQPIAMDQQIRSMTARAPLGQWILAGYSESRERVAEAAELMTALIGSERVVDALYVTEDHFWSLICADPGCCPAEGRRYDANRSPAALKAVVAGLQALDCREDLVTRIRPPRGWAARAAKRRVDDAYAVIRQLGHEQSAQLFDDLLERGLTDPTGLKAEELAMLAACAYYAGLRDVAFRRLTRINAGQHVELWQIVVQATARDDQASALGMLGLACWIVGDGAMQVVCMERGEKIAPGHSLLRLLDDINRTAAPPMIWDQLVADMFEGQEADDR